tara:strand:+ start:989 stop:1120 length:132 start_codon:yes stop_codon:yes gene_type:complete
MNKTIIIALIASAISITTWEWMHVVYGVDELPQQTTGVKDEQI